MNRKQLREELAFLLNFTEDTADQDFAKARLNKLLDRAYNLEVERAKTMASKDYFKGVSADFTWSASTQTLALPTALEGLTIIDVMDVTGGEPGFALVFAFGNGNSGGEVFWKDKDTMQWTGVGGPGSARTLRAVYEQRATDLQDDEAEPDLVPSQFHWLIVWTAAILGRTTADDQSPRDWKDERKEMRLDYTKYVSKGRPLSNSPRIQSVDPDETGVL